MYHPGSGFFATGGGPGRHRDFMTSPEVGPLFGAVLGRALDEWWDGLGRPDPFIVVEAGAGAGTLARSVLAASPACASSLHYVLVERSELLRETQAGRLPLEPARQVLGPSVVEEPDVGPETVRGTGPVVSSLAGLPSEPFTGVVFANELLDNLPFRLFERREAIWWEVRVGLGPDGPGGALVEVLVPAPPAEAAHCARFAPEAPDGGRIPLQLAAGDWLRDARRLVERGRVVLVDYADATPSFATRPWTDWVRTYQGHGRGRAPLEVPGSQDMTCEVAVDQLASVAAPAADRSQAAFLRAHGIDELAASARAAWQERAHVGDLAAMAARSRAAEAVTLTDERGLGAFRVLEWTIA